MADIRINALATTAASTASDDFVAVDGSANGTRKLNAYSPTFGGNLTVSGTTDSSSTTTGSLITSGGLGVAKKLYASGLYAKPTSGWATVETQAPAADTSSASAFVPFGTLSSTNPVWFAGHRYSAQGPLSFWVYNGTSHENTVFSLANTGNATLTGNLTVSGGTITNSSSGDCVLDQTTSGSGNYSVLRLRNTGGTAQSYDVAVGGSGTGQPQRWYVYDNTAGATRLAIMPSTGNLFIGASPVDSGNGKLQLATHTTSAGGIGFGTDVSLFRSGSGTLRLSSTATAAAFRLINSVGTTGLAIEFDNNTGYFWNYQNSSLLFGTNNTTALTLDSSQNATFAGTVRTTALGIGTAPNSYYTIIGANTLTGNPNQAFLNAAPTFDSGATGQGNVLWLQGKTAAASYTVTALSGIKIESPSLGAGSSVTTVYGLRILAQTGGTTNYAIYTDGGYIRFGSLPTSSAGLPSGTVWNDGGTLKIA